MEKIDTFEIWQPIEGFKKDVYFFNLQDDGELTISVKELDNDNQTLSITFNSALCYRITDESSRNRTTHSTPTFRGFKISKDSEFLRWFKDESSGIHEGRDLKHYLICNIDNVIDVISMVPPQVELQFGTIPSSEN